MRMGNYTIEDRTKINNHYHNTSDDNRLALDTTVICIIFTERNAVEFMIWNDYITRYHPTIHSRDVYTSNAIFIENLAETEHG